MCQFILNTHLCLRLNYCLPLKSWTLTPAGRANCHESLVCILLDSAAAPHNTAPMSLSLCLLPHSLFCRFFFFPFPPAWELQRASVGERAATEYCSVASPWQRPWFLTPIMRRAGLLIHGTKITGRGTYFIILIYAEKVLSICLGLSALGRRNLCSVCGCVWACARRWLCCLFLTKLTDFVLASLPLLPPPVCT